MEFISQCDHSNAVLMENIYLSWPKISKWNELCLKYKSTPLNSHFVLVLILVACQWHHWESIIYPLRCNYIHVYIHPSISLPPRQLELELILSLIGREEKYASGQVGQFMTRKGRQPLTLTSATYLESQISRACMSLDCRRNRAPTGYPHRQRENMQASCRKTPRRQYI